MTPAEHFLRAQGMRVHTLEPRFAAQCAALELLAFPHADPADLLSESDILAYARIFPEGFFVIVDGTRVVGQAAGLFLNFDFEHPQHTLAGVTGENQCGNHDPDGRWYYGTDIAVHPDYRRCGIGRTLYELRKELVRRRGKQGIIGGGHIPGFAGYRDRMSAAEYVAKVAACEFYDPTLSFQLRNGFVVRGLLENYVRDEGTGGWSVLITWENPEAKKDDGTRLPHSHRTETR